MKDENFVNNSVTVWYNGSGLLLYKVVADRLGLSRGYKIKSEDEFWMIMRENASHGIAVCQSQLYSSEN